VSSANTAEPIDLPFGL